ncbi:MAG: riboflavin synthase, partial [Synergistaceae bacterium]|nr:riboflavin synthase [Synergistaceae bacterium]
LDGVSLTVAGVEDARGSCRFSVGLIPATLQNCTLSRIEPGESVNVETDVVGKYVERFLRSRKNGDTAGKSGGLTLEALWNLGY